VCVRGNCNGMCLIAGVVEGDLVATAGLVFEAASKSVQYHLKSVSKKRRKKKSCHVSSLPPAIRGDGGLYCR
jgi:hypothetical protein